MTFGEKLKEARKEAGFSQEQLSDKLSVSRSAIAKWEADNGMPDIDNLKAIAQLLNISIDELLADEKKFSFRETKEAIDLDIYEKTGNCRSKKDAACYHRYSDADAIYPLIRRKKANRKEILLDLVTSWGISQLADYANDTDAYYLVEHKGKQLLVRVSDEFIATSELAKKVEPKRFIIGNNIFSKAAYRLI